MKTTRAAVIPFHHYTPFYQDNYRLIFEYFKKHFKIWKDEIDTLYFIDSHDFLYEGEAESLHDIFYPVKVKVIPTFNLSHAENLNLVIPQVEEDQVVIMDMDTIIYKKGILNMCFGFIDPNGDYYRQQKKDVYSFIERPSEKEISRFAPYFCCMNMKILRDLPELKFDPEPPTHLDPLAKLTHELIDRGVGYAEYTDDRSTIQMQVNGVILWTNAEPQKTGVYHARNFNGGIHLIDSWNCDFANACHHIKLVPTEELTRIFAWVWTINSYTIGKEKIYKDILEILKYKGVNIKDWEMFILEFQKYHSYLNV